MEYVWSIYHRFESATEPLLCVYWLSVECRIADVYDLEALRCDAASL